MAQGPNTEVIMRSLGQIWSTQCLIQNFHPPSPIVGLNCQPFTIKSMHIKISLYSLSQEKTLSILQSGTLFGHGATGWHPFSTVPTSPSSLPFLRLGVSDRVSPCLLCG